ncbi:MAG: hypothetical protein DI598_12965 [Pseudopedobacter saltans]|uniref:DUF304 domain-containing protein n=1 Tax=Pseudopedobacter saltans TaxID=151895 RepID=A0A2W5EVW6_9SPHI|nr:MAG: hypothetical protein DI598_12965 [Pseudopedobacter saltans]
MKYFEQQGSVYVKKKNYTFPVILCIILLVVAFWGFKSESMGVFWVFIILTAIFIASAMTQKLIVDVSSQTVEAKFGLIKPLAKVSFADIQTFEVLTTSVNFIRSSVYLNMYYMKNGKEKCVAIAQSYSKKNIQDVYNELQDILNNETNVSLPNH